MGFRQLVLCALVLGTAVLGCSGDDGTNFSLNEGASVKGDDGTPAEDDHAGLPDNDPEPAFDGGDPADPPVTPTPDGGTGPTTPPKGPLLKSGLHPDASDALRFLGVTASRISQTIGNAAASAGTHAKDGTVDGKPYGTATDLRTSGMSEEEIRTFLGKLGELGFAAWYRKPGADGWSGSAHIHAIWAGAAMKQSLRNQMSDWLQGKNGLVSHSTYKFFTWPESSKELVRTRFLANNPGAK